MDTEGGVGGNPLKYTDPQGLQATLSWCFGGGVPCAVGVAAAVGSLLWANNNSYQEKTPNTGTPGSWHINPGSGQERLYGSDGRPEVDIDWDHDHEPSVGTPHGHNWDWSQKPPRSFPIPISPWPRDRVCPKD